MKKRLLSCLFALLMIGAIIIPTSSASMPQLQTMTSTLSFAVPTHHGAVRTYDHRHIAWTATTTAPTHNATGVNFSLALVRGTVLNAPSVDWDNVPRNGSRRVNFNNANTASEKRFHFRFTKSDDGMTVSSNLVLLQSQTVPFA